MSLTMTTLGRTPHAGTFDPEHLAAEEYSAYLDALAAEDTRWWITGGEQEMADVLAACQDRPLTAADYADGDASMPF
jgi:hypothetical protein